MKKGRVEIQEKICGKVCSFYPFLFILPLKIYASDGKNYSTNDSQAWVYHWRGKGHASRDDLAEMPPIAAAAIFDYLEASGRLPTMEPDDYLFTALPGYIGRGGYDPKRPLARQSILDLAQKYAEIAGLSDRRMHIHTLRHTSARASYAAGASIREVQQKLRHKSMATTSIYLETLISVSDPTLDRLNAKFANL